MTKAKKPTIKELEQKIGELTEALQRERADAINIRNRHEQGLANLRTTLKAKVIEDLLPVIDNFERALSHTPKDLQNNDYVKGVKGIVKQFEETLKNMGVHKIKTLNEKFDPNLHEAVSTDGEGNNEIVSEELQAGYTLGDEVIRHAMVKVKTS
ncbi:MAG: nucleotide exchange factor GrpE [Candidatus Saccharimonadales bacterium]